MLYIKLVYHTHQSCMGYNEPSKSCKTSVNSSIVSSNGDKKALLFLLLVEYLRKIRLLNSASVQYWSYNIKRTVNMTI